uniref:Uncharacterized protein n=1 Tax=viral metagenome TaxID=1070528 RepID=A0A2V0RBW7_9ZZZZ
MFSFHRQSVNMPERQRSVLPSDRLSIEEKFEVVDSLTIRINKNESMVAQINIGKDENGETSVYMMNVNVPWDNPNPDVHVTYNRVANDAINPNSPTISNSEHDNSLSAALASYEKDLVHEITSKNTQQTINKGVFDDALKALPNIKTSAESSDVDEASLYSYEKLDDLPKFMSISPIGKKYHLRLKKDGGILCDLKSVTQKPTKRNVYVISEKDTTRRDGINSSKLTLILSKTKPKRHIDVRDLPIGVDLWLNIKDGIEYEVMKQIRELLVNFFNF